MSRKLALAMSFFAVAAVLVAIVLAAHAYEIYVAVMSMLVIVQAACMQ